MKLLKQTLLLGTLLFVMLSTAVAFAPQTSALGHGENTVVAVTDPSKKDKDKTPALKCSVLPQGLCSDAGKTKGGHSAIWTFLILILNILTAGVGVAAVIGIIIAAILYASAEDKADQVHKAKDMIWNIVLGLVCYLAMYALLQFIIPGGVFS